MAQSAALTVMALGGSWGDSIRQSIGDPFTARYGTPVRYDQRPNAQMLAALQSMAASPSVDTAEIGGSRMGQAIALGLLKKIDPAKVPNFGLVGSEHKNDYYASRYNAPWALTINTTVIPKEKADELGFDILLDPKLKGRVAIPKYGWMGEMWMNAYNLVLGGTYGNFDPIVQFCRKVVQDNEGLVMESNDHGMKLFASGEIVAAPFWTGRTYMLQDQGTKADFVYPKGWTPYGSGFVVIKGGREDLAEKFVDLSLSAAVQKPIAEKFSYSPTNRDGLELVKDLPRLRIDSAALPRAVSLDYEQMYKFVDKHLERFNKEVVG